MGRAFLPSSCTVSSLRPPVPVATVRNISHERIYDFEEIEFPKVSVMGMERAHSMKAQQSGEVRVGHQVTPHRRLFRRDSIALPESVLFDEAAGVGTLAIASFGVSGSSKIEGCVAIRR